MWRSKDRHETRHPRRRRRADRARPGRDAAPGRIGRRVRAPPRRRRRAAAELSGQVEPGRDGAHGHGRAQPARAAGAARARPAGGDRIRAGPVQPARSRRSSCGTIVSRARNLLGSDVAWLSTYDADRGEFHVLVVDGALSQGTSGMVARRDRGVASVVMSTRLPFTTPDYLHDKPLRARRRSSTTPSARKASPRWSACR